MGNKNLFSGLPESLDHEYFSELISAPNTRIERIVSKGQTSPPTGWYDQTENEWVLVLQGAGTITFESGGDVTLRPGDYINIPAGQKHKVSWTDPNQLTVWLAVFYS